MFAVQHTAAACVATWSVWQPWYLGTLSGRPVVVMGGAAWKLMALGSLRNIVMKMGNVVKSCLSPETERKRKHFFCFSFLCFIVASIYYFFEFLLNLSVFFLSFRPDLCFQKPVCIFFFFPDSAELKTFALVATLERNKVDQDCDPTHREWKVELGGWMIQIVGKSRYELWNYPDVVNENL